MADSATLPVDPDSGWPVWGNAAAVKALQRAIEQGPGHAYILTGADKFGKRLAALTFAQALNCLQRSEQHNPCQRCSNCRRIARAVFADVTLFDLTAQAEREGDKSRNLTLNISTVRGVSAAVAYRPLEARWRIVIVDDVETMQETAQEAFLKTLEEPPPYAVILLLTKDVDLLLPTIQSRCSVIRFTGTSDTSISQRLQLNGLDANEARQIASLSRGSMGWALDAMSLSGLIDERRRLIDAAQEIVDGDARARALAAVRIADEYSGNREIVFAKLGAIQGVWRERMIGDATPGDGLARAAAAIRSVDACIANLEANVRPRLALLSMVEQWPVDT